MRPEEDEEGSEAEDVLGQGLWGAGDHVARLRPEGTGPEDHKEGGAGASLAATLLQHMLQPHLPEADLLVDPHQEV